MDEAEWVPVDHTPNVDTLLLKPGEGPPIPPRRPVGFAPPGRRRRGVAVDSPSLAGARIGVRAIRA